MTTDITATVLGGALHLDQPLPLPDKSRVRLTIQPLISNEGWRQALDALARLRRDLPISSGGQRFNRADLYDRG